MGAADEITLEKAILHLLSPGEDGKAPRCSQRPLPEDTDPEVFKYFQTHIANSLVHSQARAARFTSLDQPVASACRDVLAGKADFVEVSQNLAGRLYEAVQGDGRIKRGDLVVCLYQRQAGKTVERGLALLKIDPVEVFRHETLQDEKGRRYITLVKTGAMPTAKEELQKCAFIRPLKPRPKDFDMMLLDRQRPGDKEVADFFSRQFLGAELVVDARRATLNAYEQFVDLENELRRQGVWEKAEPEVWKVLSAETVHLTREWVGDLGLPAETAARFEQKLREKEILDRPFPVDRKALEKATSKIVYLGDHELELKVLAAYFKTVVQSVKLVEPAVGFAYHEIVLHTTKWERKP